MGNWDLDVVCDLGEAQVVGRGESRGSHFSTARIMPLTLWGSHRTAINKDQYWFADTEGRDGY